MNQTPIRQALQQSIIHIRNGCIVCPKCTAECVFLKKYGTPHEIASNYDPSENNWLMLAYECSLCGLCGAVCPIGLHPDKMFLEMRREAVKRGAAPLPEHQVLLSYERRGTSRHFSYYTLPKNCRTVFFPGCALTGTRPDQTIRIYEHLKNSDPSLGVVLDCCCKPSHDLGRSDFFKAMFDEMKTFLTSHGIKQVITACPNCHRVFQSYGEPMEIVTLYEMLVQCGLPESGIIENNPVVSVHDPCGVRSNTEVHDAVRELAVEKGFSVFDMPHCRKKTLCCGEGGNVGSVALEFASTWRKKRREEADGRQLLTYCAGCAGRLNASMPTFHILDAILNPQSVVSGKVKVSKPPWTYLNRLRVKRFLKKQNPDGVTRERTFSADPPIKQKAWQRIIVLIGLAAIILAVHASGASRFLNQEYLQQWVKSWGIFAPLLYMLIYAIAPVLLLPGLPITIVGGILFGPVWGVVYTIVGATAGASLAFLVARYAARDWIKKRLISPKWKMLDEGVSRHGWKIVAFTRLLPIFPFNILNYAFGLTSIPFAHYAIASFICMLPACVAFIVFSSSLLDVIRGHISLKFVLGLILIGLVMFMPILYRYFRKKKSETL